MSRERNLIALTVVAAALAFLVTVEMVLALEPGRLSIQTTVAPQQGGTWPPPYRVAVEEDLSTTNYWAYLGPHSSVWNGYVLRNMVHSLFIWAAQRNDFVPRLAADFGTGPTLEGGFWVITVPLRQGIRWSDGQDFTAEDVVFTLETCADLGLGQNWPSRCRPDILDHVEATGPFTVTYYFTQSPGIGGWQAGVAQAPVLPKHYWEPVVQQAKTQPNPRSYLYNYVPHNEPVLGPFKLRQWVPGSYVEIVPNPRYFFYGLEVTHYANGAYQETLPGVYTFTAYGDATGPVELRYTVGPHVGSVLYSIYEDQDAAYQALLDGEVDFVLNPFSLDPDIRAELESHPDVTTVLNEDYGMYYMAFNMRKFPMSVLEFRQAVATLVDRGFPGTIVQEATDPLYTFMPPGNVFWYNPAVPRIGEGLTRQERISNTLDLLKPAGFTWTVEPSWDAGTEQVIPGHGLHYLGAPVPGIELLAPNFDYDPIRATEALSIEQWLNEAGIAVTATLTDFNHILGPVFVDVTFDTYILGWSLGSIVFPDYFESFWHSRNDTATSGNFNTPGYNNPAYDALCDDFMTTNDFGQARADNFQMQFILANDLPYLTLHTKQQLDAYYHGRLTFPYTDTLDGLERVGGMPELVHFPVYSATVSTDGGTLQVPLANTEITFPAGAVSDTVVISFTFAPRWPTGDMVGLGPFFELSAVYSDTGQQATIQPGYTYSVEILYGDAGSVIEDSLGLYWWDQAADAWSQQGINHTVDVEANVVAAEVDHFSLFALLGETIRAYLPVVLKNQQP